jgi:Recombinase
VVYEPQAEVVRAIFRALISAGTPTRAARQLRDHGVIIPDFPLELAAHERRSSVLRSVNPRRCPGGYFVPPSLVRSIVTNPVYLGWWLVEGQVVHTENHPPLVDEETFLLAQEILTEHGRSPERRAGGGTGSPQLLSGLLWCTQHAVPVRMSASVTGRGRGRYLCDQGYDNGQTDHLCTQLDRRILDEPLVDVVLGRCQFAEHADAVLAEVESEYQTMREDVRRRNRERARLLQEVETLKANLAVTQKPEQVQLLFELIDVRQARIVELGEVGGAPVGRTLTAAQVEIVRRFLADLRGGWDNQTPQLRNEFLRLVVERVLVQATHEQVDLTIR